MKDTTRQLGLGTWISIGAPVITEMASQFAFDWLLFDLEHGSMQESSLISNLQAIRRKEVKAIVRVGSLHPAQICRVLDWGAAGIMMPHVNTPEKAASCIQAMRYPPYGHRGFSGGARAYNYGLNRPQDPAKVEAPIFIAQIEDEEGVENAHKIAAVDGVHALFIGPSDLKHALSVSTGKTVPGYEVALKKVCNAAIENNRQAGILIQDPVDLAALKPFGFSCFAIKSDIGILLSGYRQIIRESEDSASRIE